MCDNLFLQWLSSASKVENVLTWSKGRVIGGAEAFAAEIKRLYGFENDLSEEEINAIRLENMQEAALEEERAKVTTAKGQ